MQNWHRQFLGRTQMPPTLSAFVISEFFTLSQSERQAVLSRYGVDMRLGTALQIGFLKMCGRPLDKFQRVPFAVLEHLNAQVGGSPPDLATLRAFYANAPRVLYRHQQIALDALGLVRFEVEADTPRVLDAICDKVRAGVDADKLLTETRVILYERHFVLPAPRAVGELAKRARETVERDVAVAIEREISPASRARWVEQIFESRADGMTCIEFLQEPPGSLNPSSITREAEKVRTLLDMNVAHMPDLPGTEKYWQMYAAKMRNQRPSRFAQRKEPRRSIELVGSLRHSLADHTDTLIRMVDRRVSQLWGRASKKAKTDQGALPALTVLVAGIRQAINNQEQSKDLRFDAIVDLMRRYDAGDLKPLSIAARQRALLVKQIQQIRPLLKSLVGLDLKADEATQWPALIGAWKDAYARGVNGLTTTMAPPKSQAWTTLLEEPKTSPRDAAEVQLLWELRQAPRRRTVHVPTSLSFQSREAMLDSRGSTITAPRSDYPVKPMLQELIAEIEDGLQRVSEAVQRGELRLDGAKVKVRRLAAQRTPPELKDIRRGLYKAYPRVQLNLPTSYDAGHSSEAATTWMVTAKYRFTPYVMLYARVATSFQPGRPNGSTPGIPLTVKGETLTNYESGLKAEFLERKALVDLSVFYVDWKDIQIGVSNGTAGYFANAGHAISQGLELTSSYSPLRGLTLGLNAAYTQCEFISVIPAANYVLTGYQLSNVPKWSMSSTVDYAWALTNLWRAHVGGGFRWIGQEWSGFGAVTDHSGYPAVVLPSYSVLDLNARIVKGPLTLKAFARNVLDKRASLQKGTYVDYVANPPAPVQIYNNLLQPRTVGIGFDYEF